MSEIHVSLNYFQIMGEAGLTYGYRRGAPIGLQHELITGDGRPVFAGSGKGDLCAFLDGVKWAGTARGKEPPDAR